jgi:hypothetical protein
MVTKASEAEGAAIITNSTFVYKVAFMASYSTKNALSCVRKSLMALIVPYVTI